MICPDVNVLVYAHRIDSVDHGRYAAWLAGLANQTEPFAVSVLSLAGFVRVVTSPRIFNEPTPVGTALAFCDRLTERRQARLVAPGPQHHEIFSELCRVTSAAGKLVADAQHAAVAIEHGCTWVTADADFARFPGLRWHHPLQYGPGPRRGH